MSHAELLLTLRGYASRPAPQSLLGSRATRLDAAGLCVVPCEHLRALLVERQEWHEQADREQRQALARQSDAHSALHETLVRKLALAEEGEARFASAYQALARWVRMHEGDPDQIIAEEGTP